MPGIDPVGFARLFEQQRAAFSAVQHVRRRRVGAHGDLRAQHHALHLGCDHHAADDHRFARLEQLKKEGEQGRKSSTSTPATGRWFWRPCRPTASRWGSRARATSSPIRAGSSASTVITLTGGTMFLMWLGEQITARGVGNGISLIIFSGIVAELPSAIAGTLELGPHRALSTS
jgi:preprotein translocase subunit SecY